jgi:uncharacterized protein YjbI with pentapeptide repeats
MIVTPHDKDECTIINRNGRFVRGNHCKEGCRRGATLRCDADFQMADLQNVDFQIHKHQSVDFYMADHQNANCQIAELQNVNFQIANFQNINFQTANRQIVTITHDSTPRGICARRSFYLGEIPVLG